MKIRIIKEEGVFRIQEYSKDGNIGHNWRYAKKALFNQLPMSISLNEVLHDYFISLDLTYDEIKIRYKELLENSRIKKIDDFFVQYK